MPYIFRRRPDRIQLQTDNPDLEVWFWLLEDQSEYSSRQKLARNYEAEGIEVQSDQLHQTANYFSCCIRQAREYYGSSEGIAGHAPSSAVLRDGLPRQDRNYAAEAGTTQVSSPRRLKGKTARFGVP